MLIVLYVLIFIFLLFVLLVYTVGYLIEKPALGLVVLSFFLMTCIGVCIKSCMKISIEQQKIDNEEKRMSQYIQDKNAKFRQEIENIDTTLVFRLREEYSSNNSFYFKVNKFDSDSAYFDVYVSSYDLKWSCQLMENVLIPSNKKGIHSELMSVVKLWDTEAYRLLEFQRFFRYCEIYRLYRPDVSAKVFFDSYPNRETTLKVINRGGEITIDSIQFLSKKHIDKPCEFPVVTKSDSVMQLVSEAIIKLEKTSIPASFLIYITDTAKQKWMFKMRRREYYKDYFVSYETVWFPDTLSRNL